MNKSTKETVSQSHEVAVNQGETPDAGTPSTNATESADTKYETPPKEESSTESTDLTLLKSTAEKFLAKDSSVEKSPVRMMVDINKLKAHPFNPVLYGKDETLSEEFLDDIKRNKILVELTIKADWTIISGHRRFFGAKAVGLTMVPVVIVDYPNDTAEKLAMISFNHNREKTFSMKMSEGEQLEVIEKASAKERQKAGKKIDPTAKTPEGEKGTTSDKIGKKIGIGKRKTYENAKQIWAIKDKYPAVADLIKKLDKGETTINAVHNAVLEILGKAKPKKEKKPASVSSGKTSSTASAVKEDGNTEPDDNSVEDNVEDVQETKSDSTMNCFRGLSKILNNGSFQVIMDTIQECRTDRSLKSVPKGKLSRAFTHLINAKTIIELVIKEGNK